MGIGSRDSTVTLISIEAAPLPALPQRCPRPSIRARTHGLEAPAPARLATVLPGPDRSGVAGVLDLRGGVAAWYPHRSPPARPRPAESSGVCVAGRGSLTHVGRFGSPCRNCLLLRLDPILPGPVSSHHYPGRTPGNHRFALLQTWRRCAFSLGFPVAREAAVLVWSRCCLYPAPAPFMLCAHFSAVKVSLRSPLVV